jgi:methionine sulfoxide reductase heme-binding subunit
MLKKLHLTWLQMVVHLGGILPLAILMRDYLTHNLTYNPIQAATQRTGDTAITLLVVSLACTPWYTLTGYADVLKRRKAIGLYAFLYASIHFLIFIGWDYGFNWLQIWQDTNTKPYIFAGLGALLILVPLAITSFRWWMKHLGKTWKRLHQLVYLAGLLAVLHFAWVVKGNFLQFRGDVSRPILYGGITTLLLVLRIPIVRRSISGFRMRVRNFRLGATVRANQVGWSKPPSLPQPPKPPERS